GQTAVGVEHPSAAAIRQHEDLLGQVLAREVGVLTGWRRHWAGAEGERMDPAVAVQLVATAPVGEEDEVAGDVVARVVRLLAQLQRRTAVGVEAAVAVQDQPVLRRARPRRRLDRPRELRSKAWPTAQGWAVREVDPTVRVERVEPAPGVRLGRRGRDLGRGLGPRARHASNRMRANHELIGVALETLGTAARGGASSGPDRRKAKPALTQGRVVLLDGEGSDLAAACRQPDAERG